MMKYFKIIDKLNDVSDQGEFEALIEEAKEISVNSKAHERLSIKKMFAAKARKTESLTFELSMFGEKSPVKTIKKQEPTQVIPDQEDSGKEEEVAEKEKVEVPAGSGEKVETEKEKEEKPQPSEITKREEKIQEVYGDVYKEEKATAKPKATATRKSASKKTSK